MISFSDYIMLSRVPPNLTLNTSKDGETSSFECFLFFSWRFLFVQIP